MAQDLDIAVVRKSVTVDLPQQAAFDIFTAKLGTWWPAGYHIGATDLKDFVMEPRSGGRWYEVGEDGTECDTGRVLTFDAPNRVVLSWHITEQWSYDPDPAHASEVEVRFVAEAPSRTRVELEHRHIERHGDGAKSIHDVVDDEMGWPLLLGRYAAAATAS
ncbi:MAG TPA: SRPBCC family protein [Acidimicrobiales bacterium]|nr:SRPBCC family protein [Acidimicrobiales bacterium]